jgi:hypothetical protein
VRLKHHPRFVDTRGQRFVRCPHSVRGSSRRESR